MGAKPLRNRKDQDLDVLREKALCEPARQEEKPVSSPLRWNSKPMGALVNLEDKEALYAILDREERGGL